MDQTERNIEIIKQRVAARTAELRKDLAEWIERQTGSAPEGHPVADSRFRTPYVEISAALLEMAIDRMLALHRGADAREFLLTAFDRQLAAYKRSLQ